MGAAWLSFERGVEPLHSDGANRLLRAVGAMTDLTACGACAAPMAGFVKTDHVFVREDVLAGRATLFS